MFNLRSEPMVRGEVSLRTVAWPAVFAKALGLPQAPSYDQHKRQAAYARVSDRTMVDTHK